MNSQCEKLYECVACGSDKLTPVLDLGNQPLANSYKFDKDTWQVEYPLAIVHCNKCYHVQLTHVIKPALMFEDYLYVSGTTQTAHQHFEDFAKMVDRLSRRYNVKESHRTVLDVGCNDGTQLDYFAKLDYKTYGVDPAANLIPQTRIKHPNVVCGYFDEHFLKAWNSIYTERVDIITAQNVFAHTDNPLHFLEVAKGLMHDNSFLIIQTSQANMIENNEFDTIYHEHVSFFNVRSMNELCKRAGLYLFEVRFMPIHGNSFIFIISKIPPHNLEDVFIDNMMKFKVPPDKPYSNSVMELIRQEDSAGLYNPETYIKYAENASKITKELKSITDVCGGGFVGWKVVGYGASAKGMTLLNYSKMHLDWVVDDNPLKQGRFTPGSSIPILPSSSLNNIDDVILFVPLAWNFFEEIKARIKLQRGNRDDKFVTYFPKVELK